MSPELYLNYLKAQSWLNIDKLNTKMLMSFMPMGLPDELWKDGVSESFFLGRIRHLPQNIELLSSFGIGGPSARMHMALAIELGVKNIVVVGTVGSLKSEIKIGDIVQFQGSSTDLDLPQVEFSSVYDLWDKPDPQADVVEMEAEVLFAWCQERSVQLTYIGVVSDIIENEAWKPGFHEIKDSLGEAHRLAYEALVREG